MGLPPPVRLKKSCNLMAPEKEAVIHTEKAQPVSNGELEEALI
jgi:hypothetical protein